MTTRGFRPQVLKCQFSWEPKMQIQTSLSSCLHPGKADLMLFAASDSRVSWTEAEPPRVWLFCVCTEAVFAADVGRGVGREQCQFSHKFSLCPCSNLQTCACLWDTTFQARGGRDPAPLLLESLGQQLSHCELRNVRSVPA